MLKWIGAIVLSACVLVVGAYRYYLYSHTSAHPPTTGELKQQTVDIDGLTRSFEYFVPSNLRKAPSLVFVLHGSRGDGPAARWQTAYRFDALAETENFIPVYPDGFENHWNDCRKSANYSANTNNIDDPAFISAMIQYFSQHYGIAPAHVYATGFSNGGHLAYRLAMELPGTLAAIAPIAASLPIAENLDCTQSHYPLSVALFNGINDPVNPYQGGLVELFGDSSRGTVMSSADTALYWRRLAKLDQTTSTDRSIASQSHAGAAIDVNQWASKQHQIRLYTLHDGGHVVPSPQVHFGALLGGNVTELEAADEIWAFFKSTQGQPQYQ